MKKLLLALGITLGMGAVAIAQTATTEEETSVTGLPTGWDEEIGTAFFTDVESGTLRPEEEVRQNWADLSAEQQASVQLHCDQMDTAAADTGTDSEMDSTTDTTASVDEDDTDTSSETTASTTADEEVNTASLTQLCDWIGDEQ